MAWGGVLAGIWTSVITTESVADLDLKPGDEVKLVIKATHVLPVKEQRPAAQRSQGRCTGTAPRDRAASALATELPQVVVEVPPT